MKHYADHAFLRRWILSSTGVLLGLCLIAQDIGMGNWRTHFSYLDARFLTVTEEKIFCASENGFFSRDIDTGEIRKLSKIDGLADVGVSALEYDAEADLLTVGYRSGYIDMIYEDRIVSIGDLAVSELDASKSINDIAIGKVNAYIATDLGVLVVRKDRSEIIENFIQIGAGGGQVEVKEILIRNDSLFIRTDEGIQIGDLTKNLLDFESWTYSAGSASYQNLQRASDQVYVLSSGRVFRYANGGWIDSGVSVPSGASKLFSDDEQLYTADDSGVIYRFTGSSFNAIASTGASSVNALAVVNNEMYVADGFQGLIDQSGDALSPEGPLDDVFSNVRIVSDRVYGFHAPSPFGFDGTIQKSQFSVFEEGRWKIESIPGFTNVSDVAAFNGIHYFGSIGDGLYNAFSETILSDIPGSASVPDTMIIAVAAGDSRLWVSSFDNESPINIMDASGNWNSYSASTVVNDQFLMVELSATGTGWLGASNGTIMVLNPEDGEVELLNTSDGLPSIFRDIDIGVEDNAWIATDKGPAVFESASFVFFDNVASRPTFDGRVLFEGENINAVMTDGGNRIWFGTDKGIWIYDENTTRQERVFDVTNSPLPSDRILQLTYDGRSGEVFILTDKGMISFRSSSSFGGNSHRQVTIFPNPVRPRYQGLVGITGLVKNASVKITDVNGNLVKEIQANGGSASWDLRDSQGGAVQTGIYLFFSASNDGEEAYVGKIAVVR